MSDAEGAIKLNDDEQAQLDRDGFVVRQNVFDAGECRAIAKDCEDLLAWLEASRAPAKAGA